MKIELLDKLKTELYRARLAVFVVFAFVMGAVFAFLATSNTVETSATTAGFKAGNIITDYVMGNSGTMSVTDIQRFLESKNACDYRDYNKYLSLMNSDAARKGYSWHWENGHFVCLAEERFDGESAAQIIYNAAQDYRINPQVLIVLLEKEQSLVTDKYPHSIQYRSATGYGCPDTAACEEKYYGFKNQVRQAAYLFRYTLDNGYSAYPEGHTVNVRWSPNEACGSSPVYIENRATAALYRYTPYQPNAAALNWGGDACSSYGNRNFYHYFTEWFGSTQQDIPIAKYQAIADGEYVITSGLTYDTALTANGTGNTANVAMGSRQANQKSQRWKVQYHSDDYTYTFTNVASGRVLDLNGQSTSNGTNLQIYDSNNTCAQRWNVIVNSDGSRTLLSACSRAIAVDVNGGSTANGANVQIYASNGTAAQKWYFIPDATIADGTYEIIAGTNDKLRLDISGGLSNLGNGTNVQVYAGNGTAAQIWSLKYNPQDGTYSILNPYKGMSLDVSGAGVNNGTNIQMYSSNGTPAQKWYILPQGNGYIIVSQSSGRVLDVNGASTSSGANVQIYGSNGSNAQTWRFYAPEPTIEDGLYEIITMVNAQRAMDISGGSGNARNGTNIQIYETNQTGAQKWQISYDKTTASYMIINPDAKLSLDVNGGSTASSANVQVYSSNGTPAQRWRIVKNDDGSYTIFNIGSNLPLDVYGASSNNGANIQQYSSNGTPAQKWQLRKLAN